MSDKKLRYFEKIKLQKIEEAKDWEVPDKKNIHTIHVDYGRNDAYFHCKALEKAKLNKDLPKIYWRDYSPIIRAYMELAWEDLFTKGRPMYLFGCGWLTIQEFKSRKFLIDWPRTKQLKLDKPIKKLVPTYYYIKWVKKGRSKHFYYSFRPHKKYKKILVEHVKKGTIRLSGLTNSVYKIKGASRNVI